MGEDLYLDGSRDEFVDQVEKAKECEMIKAEPEKKDRLGSRDELERILWG